MNGFNVRRFYSLIDKREQYARNWSIRINHLNVPPRLIERLGLSLAVMHTAYQRIIAPVLHKVLQNWNLHEFGVQGVPALLDLLENGHFLGKKWKVQGTNIEGPQTIIIRFVSRWWRNLFLKNKRFNMPKPTYEECARFKVKYFFVTPDLTAMNFNYLMTLKNDPRIQSVWTQDGQFRFKLKTNLNKVWQASDTLMSLDEIIQNDTPKRTQNDKFTNPLATPSPIQNVSQTPENIPISANTEPANVPASESAGEPVTAPVTELVKDPATEPVTETIAESTIEPVPSPQSIPSNKQKHEPTHANQTSITINTATSVPETASISSPELGAKPKTRAQMCNKVGNMRITTPKRKHGYNKKGRPLDKKKEDAIVAIKDLEAAFTTDAAIGDTTVTVDDFDCTSSEIGQLPTDQDLKHNKFQESNFSS